MSGATELVGRADRNVCSTSATVRSPFDLGGSDRDPVARLEHGLSQCRLAIDTDQVVRWLALRQPLFKEFLNGGPVRDVDLVGESAAVVVDEEDLHGWGLLLGVLRRG